MRGHRIPDETKAAILADIRAGKKSRNAIAREHGVGVATVTTIAQSADLSFDRSATENATRARLADFAARRAALADGALTLAERMQVRAASTYKFVVATKDDVHTVELDEPPLAEVRNAAISYGVYLDKHMALVKFDQADNSDATRSLLGTLAAGLQGAYEALTAPDAPEA